MMRNYHLSLIATLWLLGSMIVVVFPVRAQDELVVVESAHATMYLNGGFGQDEEQYMRKSAKDWPLRLSFSARPDDEFAADVSLLITDMRGAPYLQISNAGPLTFVRLPSGKYRIYARFHGKAEIREVTLEGTVGRDVNFHWKRAG